MSTVAVSRDAAGPSREVAGGSTAAGSAARTGTDTATRPAILLDGVSKRYAGATGVLALDHISISVSPGEFVCVVGASGCGKSTMLNIVSNLDEPTSGTVSVDGHAALMFQESALFPWLSALDNVAAPLRLKGVPKKERHQQARDYLATVHLEEFADRRPHELSGGMRQRVAIARTLATQAPVLLMDEPFGALDAMTRDLLHDELENIWAARGLSVLFVTHNVREAVRLGDRVLLLSSRPGRVAREYAVDFDRPRRIEDPAVSALSGEITNALRQEVARHGR